MSKNKITVLLVEDEQTLAMIIKDTLEENDFIIHTANDGEEGLSLFFELHPDVLVADVMMPKMDGISVLRELRKEGNAVPVLLLTAKDSIEDRVTGLDAGADDYLVKPFHMSELLARMRAVMRRRNGAAANVLSNGDLSLSEAAKTVERAGQTYTLTKREYALLSALLARPGAILSRRALEDRIYAVGEEPDSNAVEYLIHALRKKLGADAVKNVRGLGWMVAGRDAKPE